MTITIYGGPQTRASMPRWYLEEKGIAYKLVEIALSSDQNMQSDFLSVNPFGKLPAMRDQSITDSEGKEITLFESGAILLHLAEHHGGEAITAHQNRRSASGLISLIRLSHLQFLFQTRKRKSFRDCLSNSTRNSQRAFSWVMLGVLLTVR